MVKMLMSAPPLCQDFSNANVLHVSKPEIMSNEQIQAHNYNSTCGMEVAQNPACNMDITPSRLLLLKTTSEALEELQIYRDMKDKLLNHGS